MKARRIHGSRTAKLMPVLGTLMLLCAGHGSAQSVILSNVQDTLTPLFPSYNYTQNGYNPGSFKYYNFTFGISSGTGAGSSLVGGNYMGFCVNTFLSDPATGYSYNLDTTGIVLSYAVNGSSDYWNTNTALKYGALQDVLYTYAGQFVTTPKNSQAYADLVTAFGILSSEVVLDYDGTKPSLNLTSGASTVTDSLGNPVSGNVLSNYNSMAGVVGTGVGHGFNLYAAGWPDPDPSIGAQDMVFFAVPEPSTAILGGLGVLRLLLSRRRAG